VDVFEKEWKTELVTLIYVGNNESIHDFVYLYNILFRKNVNIEIIKANNSFIQKQMIATFRKKLMISLLTNTAGDLYTKELSNRINNQIKTKEFKETFSEIQNNIAKLETINTHLKGFF